MKRTILALLLASTATAAQAVELNPDVGFDTPGSWMVMGDTAHASVTGGKAVFTGVTKTTMLSISSSAIKKNHKYRLSFVVSGYGSGSVTGYVGMTMSGSVTGSSVAAADINGVTPIGDNFTTASGLTGDIAMPSSIDSVGQFRMTCGAGPIRPDDPIVYPGIAGRSHPHQFFGNTAINAFSTYNSIRTKGMTTCGSAGDPTHPINRSGYWFPAMDGGDGYFRSVDIIKLYYKRLPVGAFGCKANGSSTDTCVNVPHGLRMIAGWKSSDNSNGATSSGIVDYYCTTQTETTGGQLSHSLDMNTAISASACVSAYAAKQHPHLEVEFRFPQCWNGTQVDTADHRSHMAFEQNFGGADFQCPADHPYRIANITGSLLFALDAAAFAGKWRWSSDSTFAGNVGGFTFHTDYFEGWSPTVKATWHQYCINGHLSCNGSSLGNGTKIKTSPVIASTGGEQNEQNSSIGLLYSSTKHLVPTSVAGYGKPCKANGTCTVEVVAAGANEFGLMTTNANLQVDNLSVTEIPTGAKGPVTVTH
jgi:hypothetical protein